MSELWLFLDLLICSLTSDSLSYALCIFLKETLSLPTHSLLGRQTSWALNPNRPDFEFWIFPFLMSPLVIYTTDSISICPDEKSVHSAGTYQTPAMCQVLSSAWEESLSENGQKSLHSCSLHFSGEGKGIIHKIGE